MNHNNKTARFTVEELLILSVLGLVAFSLSVKIGLRPIHVGSDYRRYFNQYQEMRHEGEVLGKGDLGYEMIALLFSNSEIPSEVFFIFFAMLTFFSMGYAIWLISGKTFFSDNRKKIFSFVLASSLLMPWPFLWSGLINVITHGLSVSILFLALYALYRGRYWSFGSLIVLSSLFHWSAPAFGASAILWKAIGSRWMLRVVIVGGLCYGVGLSSHVLLSVEKITGLRIYTEIANYSDSSSYEKGHRLDFLLFSSIPIAVWCGARLWSSRLADESLLVMGIYCALLLPFLIFGFGAYSDRLAMAAWQFMPVVLAGLVTSAFRMDLYFATLVALVLFSTSMYAVLSLPMPLALLSDLR